MVYYSIKGLSEVIRISEGRVRVLIRQGRGPELNESGKVSTESAMRWCVFMIDRCYMQPHTESHSAKWELAARRLRVDAYIQHVRSQPKPEPKPLTRTLEARRAEYEAHIQRNEETGRFLPFDIRPGKPKSQAPGKGHSKQPGASEARFLPASGKAIPSI
jgi:hypothetical protein